MKYTELLLAGVLLTLSPVIKAADPVVTPADRRPETMDRRYDPNRPYDRARYDSEYDYRHDRRDFWSTERYPGDKFAATEVSLDMFGTVSIGDHSFKNPSVGRIRRDGRLGLGLGASYFLTRQLGLGAEAYTESTSHNFVDNLLGSVIFRWPVADTCVAPYVYGGGGYQFDPLGQWTGHVGGGVEFRFAPNWGLFTDLRYVIADRSKNYGLGRFGVRYSY